MRRWLAIVRLLLKLPLTPSSGVSARARRSESQERRLDDVFSMVISGALNALDRIQSSIGVTAFSSAIEWNDHYLSCSYRCSPWSSQRRVRHA